MTSKILWLAGFIIGAWGIFAWFGLAFWIIQYFYGPNGLLSDSHGPLIIYFGMAPFSLLFIGWMTHCLLRLLED
jgi:hypothetical protein